MLRITRETDYGILLLIRLTQVYPDARMNARDLATETELPLPMVSKILKRLTTCDLLRSVRGVKGGYTLNEPPEEITLDRIVALLEGSLGLTTCHADDCDRRETCPATQPWQVVNDAIESALGDVTLADLATGRIPSFRYMHSKPLRFSVARAPERHEHEENTDERKNDCA